MVSIDFDPEEPDVSGDAGRAREIPAVPEQPGGWEAGDGAGSDAFRRRQIAAHVEYRERVAAADRAREARQAWAEGVPGLRAAWAEHLQNHPQRSVVRPETQPDGSWAAGDGRGLNPEQNAEATKACADLRDEAEQVILPAMRRVEAASPDGTRAGLEHMLKGEDRTRPNEATPPTTSPRSPKMKRSGSWIGSAPLRPTRTGDPSRLPESALSELAGELPPGAGAEGQRAAVAVCRVADQDHTTVSGGLDACFAVCAVTGLAPVACLDALNAAVCGVVGLAPVACLVSHSVLASVMM